MVENQTKRNKLTTMLITLCIILACAIIAAAIIIPTVINENQKKLSANQSMTDVIDNIRKSISSERIEPEEYIVDFEYTKYLVENIDAYTQKGTGLLNSDYVNQELKDEYNELIEKVSYYKTMQDINDKISSRKYATANRMLNSIDNQKSFIELNWQKALRNYMDYSMCEVLNYERIKKAMHDLMEENNITQSYENMDIDELTDYPSEPYGICGRLIVDDYNKSSGIGTFRIIPADKGLVSYQLMQAKDYYSRTRNDGIYVAFVFTGRGGYKSRYYDYENNITNPNGDYRDF